MTKPCRSIRSATFTDNFEQISKNFCILFKTLLIFCEESPTLSNQHENYSSYIIYMFKYDTSVLWNYLTQVRKTTFDPEKRLYRRLDNNWWCDSLQVYHQICIHNGKIWTCSTCHVSSKQHGKYNDWKEKECIDTLLSATDDDNDVRLGVAYDHMIKKRDVSDVLSSVVDSSRGLSCKLIVKFIKAGVNYQFQQLLNYLTANVGNIVG